MRYAFIAHVSISYVWYDAVECNRRAFAARVPIIRNARHKWTGSLYPMAVSIIARVTIIKFS